MAASRRRDIRLERREERVLSAMVMTGSTVLRRIGGTRAGELAAHRLLDHDDVTPEITIANAAERTRDAMRGRHILLVQDTTEINFSGADRSRSGLGPAGDGKALGFFIHAGLAVDLAEEAVLGVAHAQIWTRGSKPVSDRKARAIEDKESMRWLDATAAAGELVGIAAGVTSVSDREGDIYQHFARRPAGVERIVRAHHDRRLVGGGQMFAAAQGFGEASCAMFSWRLAARETRVARRASGCAPAGSRSPGRTPPTRAGPHKPDARARRGGRDRSTHGQRRQAVAVADRDDAAGGPGA